MKLKHVFVMNPVSGSRLARKMKRQIAVVCRRLRVDYHVHFTTSADDGPKYVRQLLEKHPDDYYRIYACGGDGTICDICGSLVGHPNAELAVIPLGTGNDFTRNFGKPSDFRDIEDYINGAPIDIDLIKYNDEYSINVSNMGFDCEVVDMMERNRNKPFMNNSFSYTLCVIGCLIRMPKGHVRFTMEDGTEKEEKFLLSLIANGAYYGGGYKAASKADLQDGLLEWIVVPENVTRMDFVKMVDHYKKGTLLDSKPLCEKYGIRYHRVKKIVLEALEPMKICVDGEIKVIDKMVIEPVSRAIKFTLPRKLYNCFKGDKTLKNPMPV